MFKPRIFIAALSEADVCALAIAIGRWLRWFEVRIQCVGDRGGLISPLDNIAHAGF
jgi:hypothetical protein